MPGASLDAGIPVLSLFVQAGLASSNGDARRQVKGGGLKVNDETLTDEQRMIGRADLVDGAVKLSLGRKKHVLVRAE